MYLESKPSVSSRDKVRIMSRVRDSICERSEEYDVDYKLCCSWMAVGV